MNRERKKRPEGNGEEEKKKMEKINFLILFVLDLLSHPIGSGNEGEWDDDSRYGEEESSVKILNSCTHPRLFSIIDDCGNDFDFHFDNSSSSNKNVRAVDFDPTSSLLCVVWDMASERERVCVSEIEIRWCENVFKFTWSFYRWFPSLHPGSTRSQSINIVEQSGERSNNTMTNIVIVFHFQFFTFALLCAVLLLCLHSLLSFSSSLLLNLLIKRGELVDVDKIEIAAMKFTSTNSTQSD